MKKSDDDKTSDIRYISGLSEFAEFPGNIVVPIRSNPELDAIKSISYDEMMASKPSPLEHILFPWLPVQGIAFIFAATGVGKTLFTMNIAYAIANGGNFLKYSVPKPKKVLYIDGEMAYTQVHARFNEIVKQQGVLYYPEMWSLFTPDKILPFRLPKLDDPYGQEFYNKFLEKEKIEVVVFDNLSTLSAFDENSSSEWKPIQDWLLHLRSIGLTIIVVHHAGKDASGYRGTSRMIDCADTAISLQTPSDDKLESEDQDVTKFKINYLKKRSFGGVHGLPFEASISKNNIWTHKAIEQTNMEFVIERMNMKMSQKDIANELKKSRPYVNKLVQKARKLKLLID